ncbi:MAG: sugar phosphate isomerase/epimerase family protein [Armatimonadota bacterium]|jgi:sugar phosphate isomerase/epimerase
MHRPLAISTTMLDGSITVDGLREAASRGITHLEIFIPADGQTRDRPSEFDADALAEVIGEAGMEVWSVHAPFGGGVDLSHPDELVRRDSVGQIRAACEVASALGANCVVAHAGLSTGDANEREIRRRQSLRSINCLLKCTCRLEVCLAMEYLPANKPRLCNDSAQISEMLDLCDGRPGVCLDTNHANLRESLAAATRALAERIVTLHISDNDGEQERHMMPGEGVIDWREFMDVLDEIGYEGPLVYEAVGGETLAERMEMTVTSARDVLGWEGPDG